MKRVYSLALVGFLSVFIATACSKSSSTEEPTATQATGNPTKEKHATTPNKLEPYECGTIERLHTYGGDIFLASQPQQQDIHDANDVGGIKTVVNLRLPDEFNAFDEEKLVTSLGMEYISIPFKPTDTLTDEVFDTSRNILNDLAKRPLLMHCSSGNRVGALWLAHRVLDGGLSFEDALAEAKMVGLKSKPYEDKARDYVNRKK